MGLATYGIVILGVFIGAAGHAIVNNQDNAAKKERKALTTKLIETIDREEDENDRLSDYSSECPAQKHKYDKPLGESIIRIVLLELPIVTVVLVIGLLIGYYEGWSILER